MKNWHTELKTFDSNGNGQHRIVLTGGPGAGKTTAADLFRREIGERIVVVPEAATMLFSGGFPRHKIDAARRATQYTIYNVQRNLENIIRHQYPNRILLCDRGTIDGAAYWPEGEESFYKALKVTRDEEYSRYDAVIFFESAAVGGDSIEGCNPTRTESDKEAIAINEKLKEIWRHHPNFHYIPHNKSFFKKISSAIKLLEEIVKKASEKNEKTK